eukprot:scaffold5843_cov125-Isochrysis_galbana.AAC.9
MLLFKVLKRARPLQRAHALAIRGYRSTRGARGARVGPAREEVGKGGHGKITARRRQSRRQTSSQGTPELPGGHPLRPPGMLPSAVDSSEPVSEAESSSGSFDLGPELVRQLRLDLEAERRQNKNLVAKLKRATKLNEQLVRACAPQRSQRGTARGGRRHRRPLGRGHASSAPPVPARALRCGQGGSAPSLCACRPARSKRRQSKRRST